MYVYIYVLKVKNSIVTFLYSRVYNFALKIETETALQNIIILVSFITLTAI